MCAIVFTTVVRAENKRRELLELRRRVTAKTAVCCLARIVESSRGTRMMKTEERASRLGGTLKICSFTQINTVSTSIYTLTRRTIKLLCDIAVFEGFLNGVDDDEKDDDKRYTKSKV